MLKDFAEKYYNDNYNCAEAVIRGGNDYYGLGLNDRDMIMMAGFGGGIQTGNTCGAIVGAVGLLSMKYVEVKAHESADLKPITVAFIRNLNAKYGSILCKDIKPQSFTPEIRCMGTIATVCDILEKTIEEYNKI